MTSVDAELKAMMAEREASLLARFMAPGDTIELTRSESRSVGYFLQGMQHGLVKPRKLRPLDPIINVKPRERDVPTWVIQ